MISHIQHILLKCLLLHQLQRQQHRQIWNSTCETLNLILHYFTFDNNVTPDNFTNKGGGRTKLPLGKPVR